MITVLCPSRNRRAQLEASIRGLREQAHRSDLVEVLVAADPDDEYTQHAQIGWPAHIWTAPERYGYHQLHRYYNELALNYATGDWLLLWNDDAVMVTERWDDIIHAQPPSVLWPRTNDAPGANVFPIWPRPWTVHLQHVSLSPHCDTWMQEVGQGLGLQRPVRIDIRHETARLTGQNDDATYAEGQAGYRRDEFYGPEMAAARQADIRHLRGVISERGMGRAR